jgi:oxygen-independent coproporphyrinogen-3 oxidase
VKATVRSETLLELRDGLAPPARDNVWVARAFERLRALDIEERQRGIKTLNRGATAKPYLHAVAGDGGRVVPYGALIRNIGAFPARIGALYLHFPYCTKKCRFCHYYTDSTGALDDWARAPERLADELALLRRAYGLAGPVDAETIHFGGGTPSLIPAESWARVNRRLAEHVAFDRATENAIEADPEDLEQDKIDAWRATGVNRVSVGVQSFDREVLRYMRRGHDRGQAEAGLARLAAAGVENVNVDLMYGMPFRPLASWLDDLAIVADHAPDSITCYATRPDPRNRTDAAVGFPSDAWRLLAHQVAIEFLMARGYTQYAPNQFVSGPRGACRAKNNRNRCEDVLGLGPRAHSIFQGWFYEGVAAQAAYEATITAGRLGDVRATKIAGREAKIRFLQFGIKLSGLGKFPPDNGIPPGHYRAVFGSTLEEDFAPELEQLERLGLVAHGDDGALSLTPSGVVLVHEVVKRFGPAGEG